MSKKKMILRPILFCLICLLVFIPVSKVLNVSNTYSEHAEMMINGYYDLEKDTVDAVFLGNSHVYRYWQSAFAWKEMGMATTAWSTSNMPFGTIKRVTEEALKTQSPKVLCVEASLFQKENADARNKIYLALQSMKESPTKYQMIHDFCKINDIDLKSQIKYYIPFLQFHSRWYEINEGDFRQLDESYLNSCYETKFLEYELSGVERVSSEKQSSISEKAETALREYLDYCNSLDCEVLFFFSPTWDVKRIKHDNYIKSVIEEYGYSVIDFNEAEYYEKLGLNEATDLQDINHTNVKGSFKFTLCMGDILRERYELADRSQEPGREEWDEASRQYYDIVSPYLNR